MAGIKRVIRARVNAEDADGLELEQAFLAERGVIGIQLRSTETGFSDTIHVELMNSTPEGSVPAPVRVEEAHD